MFSQDEIKEALKAAYEDGMNIAWEAAGKLVSMEYWKVNDILSDGVLTVETNEEIFVRCTATEAIERIHAYEEQKKQEEDEEIKVGDEVIIVDKPQYNKMVVTGLWYSVENGEIQYDKKGFYAMNQDCNSYSFEEKMARKTGRHFPEIAEVLKKMKEGE